MKKRSILFLVVGIVAVFSLLLFFNGGTKEEKGAGGGKKAEISIIWAEYDGLTPEFAEQMKKGFEEKYPNATLTVISTPWNQVHDRLVTSLGGDNPPDLSIIGTRWVLEFKDQLEPPEKWVSKETLDDILPSIKEAVVNGQLLALPDAWGPRILVYRSDLIDNPPKTFEEMLEVAKKVNNPPDIYAVGMSGKKYAELTEFVYYFYGAGGEFFEKNPDGSLGKCTVNSEAGVKALTFMNDLVNKYKVTEPAVTNYTRDEIQDLMVSGHLAMMMTGGFTPAILKAKKVPFKWDVAQMPYFEGYKPCTLMVTDSIAFFKSSKNKELVGKFLDYFYSPEVQIPFQKLIGFPPVTKSASKDPYFQTKVYKVMTEAGAHAKGWPLVAEWSEATDILWDAIASVFLGKATPKEALDRAAKEIDSIRGM